MIGFYRSFRKADHKQEPRQLAHDGALRYGMPLAFFMAWSAVRNTTEYNANCGGRAENELIAWRRGRYKSNLAADVRIVATCTGDGNSLQFQVVEPGRFICSRAASPSPHGGYLSMSGGRREYMIRRAVPGVYQISCASDHPVTVRLILHTRWGHPDQQSKVVTLLLDDERLNQVGEIEFEFCPAKSE